MMDIIVYGMVMDVVVYGMVMDVVVYGWWWLILAYNYLLDAISMIKNYNNFVRVWMPHYPD